MFDPDDWALQNACAERLFAYAAKLRAEKERNEAIRTAIRTSRRSPIRTGTSK